MAVGEIVEQITARYLQELTKHLNSCNNIEPHPPVCPAPHRQTPSLYIRVPGGHVVVVVVISLPEGVMVVVVVWLRVAEGEGVE